MGKHEKIVPKQYPNTIDNAFEYPNPFSPDPIFIVKPSSQERCFSTFVEKNSVLSWKGMTILTAQHSARKRYLKYCSYPCQNSAILEWVAQKYGPLKK